LVLKRELISPGFRTTWRDLERLEQPLVGGVEVEMPEVVARVETSTM
jgi:hypothetical protein